MGRRRGNKRSYLAVTFFSFQDIITALAGSMLIVVLLTALIHTRETEKNTPQPAAGNRSYYEELQTRINLSRTELEKRRRDLAALKDNLQEKRMSEQLQKENLHLRQELAKLEKIEHDYRRMEAQLTAELARYKSQTAARDARQSELAQLLKQRNELEKVLADRLSRLKLQEIDGKKNVLLDCSRTQWFWSEDPGRKELLNGNDVTPATALKNLRNKLKQRSLAKTRLVIAVRPSAGGFFQALKGRLHQEFPALEIATEPMASETVGELVL